MTDLQRKLLGAPLAILAALAALGGVGWLVGWLVLRMGDLVAAGRIQWSPSFVMLLVGIVAAGILLRVRMGRRRKARLKAREP